MGAVPAPMCPLTPCMTPLHHVPRTRRTNGARPLSSHNVTQIALHYFFALPLPLPLPLPPPFLGARGAGFRICSKEKYAASVVGTNPGLGQHCMPMDNGTWQPCVYKYVCEMGNGLLGVA